jgi:hypothetical protein
MGGVWGKISSAANTAAVHGEDGPEGVEVGLGEGGGGGQNDRDVLQQAAGGREEGLRKERPSFNSWILDKKTVKKPRPTGLKKKGEEGGGGTKIQDKRWNICPLRMRSFIIMDPGCGTLTLS